MFTFRRFEVDGLKINYTETKNFVAYFDDFAIHKDARLEFFSKFKRLVISALNQL